ncbi:MAG TPA: transglutaminase-like domain-containing protein [Planctomycetaceae bacterium]|nr:transglutaminase-like domain-containing protein [Planctomycetaceae bacterium]
MFPERDFSHDVEFSKLLLRDSDVDLTIVSLEIARDANPGLRFEDTLEWIAARAAELSGPAAAAWSEADALRALCRLMAETHGLRGDGEAYQRAESSYLPEVIACQRGIPISLSILYMAVARAAGIELKAVAAPQHFLTRFDGLEGPLFIDPFGGGRILDRDECLQFLHELTNMPESELKPRLKPVGPRAIVIRMLNNLKVLHAKQEDWPAAWLVQERLVALKPSSYEERRDLAFIALKCERSQQALEMLDGCLAECPDDQTELLQQHIEEAKRQFARWN